MKKLPEHKRELELQLVEVTPPRDRRAWLPGAQFANHELDTRRWRRAPAPNLDWQRTPTWLPRQRLN